MKGYVTYKIKDESLFQVDTAVGTPSGKTRIADDGEVEAELLCLNRKVNQATVWVRKEDLVIPTPTA